MKINTHSKSNVRRSGFTLIEVTLVMVIVVILSGIALPHFASFYRGSELRSASRTIYRMARYARGTAIMREQTMTIVIDSETMEIYLGATTQASTNSADGELDQAVLKRLGYIDGEASAENIGVEREVHRYLPDTLKVSDFEKEWIDGEAPYENFYLIRYYSDGQADWFKLELESKHGLRVNLEGDPISGKILSEFEQ